MKWLLVTFAMLSYNCSFAQIPLLNEDWIEIASKPKLGWLQSEEQQPVDFGIWQASNGEWQLWSCIRKTKESGKTRLFHGWSSTDLARADWAAKGIMMRADTTLGEMAGGMQAPFVLRDEEEFKMFYGDWNRICLASSTDGVHFSRVLKLMDPSLFGDPAETNTRDAMVLKTGEHGWICYYTAHPGDLGSIFARTSKDLVHWSDSRVVSSGSPDDQDNFWRAECPFVIYYADHYFLFRTANYGQNGRTHIYRSKDPLDFGEDGKENYLTTLDVAAPEIFQYNDKWYIACLLPSLQGIRLGTLRWSD